MCAGLSVVVLELSLLADLRWQRYFVAWSLARRARDPAKPGDELFLVPLPWWKEWCAHVGGFTAAEVSVWAALLSTLPHGRKAFEVTISQTAGLDACERITCALSPAGEGVTAAYRYAGLEHVLPVVGVQPLHLHHASAGAALSRSSLHAFASAALAWLRELYAGAALAQAAPPPPSAADLLLAGAQPMVHNDLSDALFGSAAVADSDLGCVGPTLRPHVRSHNFVSLPRSAWDALRVWYGTPPSSLLGGIVTGTTSGSASATATHSSSACTTESSGLADTDTVQRAPGASVSVAGAARNTVAARMK